MEKVRQVVLRTELADYVYDAKAGAWDRAQTFVANDSGLRFARHVVRAESPPEWARVNRRAAECCGIVMAEDIPAYHWLGEEAEDAG